jgi:hypothetical protein
MWSSHERIDLRSIALHAAVAKRLESNPERWAIVQENLQRQLAEGGASRPYAVSWKELLELPWERLRELLIEDSERMRALRQASPFAGVLDGQERWAIFDQYSLARSATE